MLLLLNFERSLCPRCNAAPDLPRTISSQAFDNFFIAMKHLSLIFTISAPSPPTNVVAVSLNATTISISWSRPAQPNGQITRYEIQYNAVGSSDVTSNVLSANHIPGLNTLIGSLKPFTRYQFRIRAATGVMVMWGNYSAAVEETTGEAGSNLRVDSDYPFFLLMFLLSVTTSSLEEFRD